MKKLHTKTLNHEKFNIKYHIIFSTKYRRKFLNSLKEDLFETLRKSSNGKLWEIEIMNIDKDKPDHIHLIISSAPSVSVSEIVHQLKQFSTYYMWKKHPELLKKYYWSGKHYFWTRGCYCSSIGDASFKTVEKYILEQGN